MKRNRCEVEKKGRSEESEHEITSDRLRCIDETKYGRSQEFYILKISKIKGNALAIIFVFA